mmetsp:Transcript_41255/g.131130  ORF Transcript_41255/g.131130 Transcript_41255/m.131130 type:complete len:200 (-) Transcript_41255:1109-1708(-)
MTSTSEFADQSGLVLWQATALRIVDADLFCYSSQVSAPVATEDGDVQAQLPQLRHGQGTALAQWVLKEGATNLDVARTGVAYGKVHLEQRHATAAASTRQCWEPEALEEDHSAHGHAAPPHSARHAAAIDDLVVLCWEGSDTFVLCVSAERLGQRVLGEQFDARDALQGVSPSCITDGATLNLKRADHRLALGERAGLV